ncbi:gem-associated protein 5 [Halyomorpha halys]|uniref:gem-associated protein 5 n=1 Tax=Halyomorpha halys TaxID=286706 RepID=UPI0006D500D4|nr:gem-associated protein 5 [Halyomorpha halys]
MCEITIPSSPSWYFSNILACNDEGTALAYGAKHEVVILRQISNNFKPCDAQPIFIPMAHKDKVSALAFAPSNSENFKDHLVSCSEDGTVHVWNWPSQFLILAHSGHPDGQKLIGVDWSRADPNLIVSVSEFCSIVCWDLPSNTIRRLSINTKISPVCMSCCPHNKDLIAVGAKAGLIVIYNVKGDGFITFRLRAHETDVVSLAWCPVPNNIFQKDDSENTYLLASGAKDRNIYFWRAGTDGRYETFIQLPATPLATTGYRSKNGVGGQGSHWICVRWPDASTILSSSLFGELICYDLQQIFNSPVDKNIPKEKKGKIKAVRLIHGNHTKGLFSIAIPYGSKKEGDDRMVWTYALDKRLIASKLDCSKVLSSMATIGGIVYCMAVCPLDPNRIAIGTGDNRILVWNMSNDSCDNITCLWNKINNKVMAVAWHPTLESVLAFGTGEGRIGLLDVDNATKSTTLLRLYHRKSVYSLIWGPPIVDEIFIKGKKALSLFSVGDGDILQYNPDTPDKDPVSLNPLFKACDSIAKVSKSLGRTDLAWNSSRSLAAIGNDNGVLYIVDGKDMSHVHTIFAHKKLVQCIVWHPATVTSESTPSPYSSWLASASDNIQIVNVTTAGVEVVACLSTHSEKVVSLAWSPHFNSRLVSASYDYTSQVWDVASGSVLACFDGHHSAVMCCLPSMLHPDCVITGSADSTVRLWNVNKYKLTKTKTKKQRLSGVLKKFAGVQEAKDAKNSLDLRVQPTTNGFKNDLKEEEGPQISTSVPNVDLINRHKKNKSMFPVTSGGTSQAKYLNVLWSRIRGEPPSTPEESDYGYLDFFGDTNSIRRLLNVEGNHHKNTGNVAYTRYLSLWSGNISETIKDAIWKKELNDHLVSLAPMVSHKLWVDCCRSYATQLAENGDIYKAVSYLLAIHQVEEAIELLTESKYFREAVVLAKSRFPTFDPIVKKVLDAWAAHCISTGMLSLAAHCVLSNGSNIEAVEILSRSKDNAFISLAAEIASKSDAQEMAVSLALRAINGSLEKLDFELARKTSLQHPQLKEALCWIEICSLITVWKPLSSSEAISWICGQPDVQHSSIFEKALKLTEGVSYNKLIRFMPNKPTDESENKVWVYISGQLGLAGCSEDKNMSLRHVVLAVSAAYRYHVQNPTSSARIFLQLCPWISPSGPLGDIKVFETCDKSLKESLNTFFASCVVYWLEELIRKSEINFNESTTIHKINDVVKECAKLVFHKNILNYYKYEVELKKLENSIAVNKLKLLKSMKYCKEIEAKLQGEPIATNGTICDDSSGSLENQDLSESKPSEENSAEKAEDEAEKYNKLKSLKSKFEDERIDSPNPFILYCTMRSFMQKIMDHNENSRETMEIISNEIVGKSFE